MSQQKLVRYAALRDMPHVFEDDTTNLTQKGFEIPSDWQQEVFKNENPIVLELACGKGEYAVGLAQMQPDKNYVGIDIKGNRIWKGALKAEDLGLKNVAFLRGHIDKIEYFFPPNSISEIWITFSDPYLKKSKRKKRLTSALFLNRYRKILKCDGIIHLKTDSDVLHEFTLETIAEEKCKLLINNNNIYAGELPDERLSIKTYYENMHLTNGKTIKYVSFQL